jgi:hypothetical protein
VGLYTDTSKLKWIFWTSHHSVLLIDMMLKSSRNLSTRTNGSLGLQIRNNQSMIKTTLTNNFLKTSLSHRKRRVTGRRRRTLKNGAISTKAPGTTPMNVAQNNHWWPRSKTRSQTLIQNLILKILVKDRSSTQTPLLLSRPTIQPEEPIDPEEGEHLFHSQMWVKGTRCILLLIEEARRTSSQQRSSNNWDCRQHHTRNHTTSGGFAKEKIFVSANNVDCHTTSSPSRMRYYVMLPQWMSVMFSWANHICGSTMLFMSLDPVVSLLLWGVISTEYQR